MEEKRKEKEKLDRQWGLVGLGQDSYTGQMASAKPWYASKQPPNAAAFDGLNTASAPHGAAPFGIQRSAEEKVAKDARNKARADPVADMNKYLGKTRRHKEEKKKHRHDSDRRGSRHKGTGDTGLSEAEKRAKLEKLRSERLAREAGERARLAEIMGMGRTGTFSTWLLGEVWLVTPLTRFVHAPWHRYRYRNRGADYGCGSPHAHRRLPLRLQFRVRQLPRRPCPR